MRAGSQPPPRREEGGFQLRPHSTFAPEYVPTLKMLWYKNIPLVGPPPSREASVSRLAIAIFIFCQFQLYLSLLSCRELLEDVVFRTYRYAPIFEKRGETRNRPPVSPVNAQAE